MRPVGAGMKSCREWNARRSPRGGFRLVIVSEREAQEELQRETLLAGDLVDPLQAEAAPPRHRTSRSASPDVAINHDAEALRDARGQPRGSTLHLHGDVWHLRAADGDAGSTRRVALALPDCMHFSKAKGGKPLSRKRRASRPSAIRWARDVRPDVISAPRTSGRGGQHWGPLTADLAPCLAARGSASGRGVEVWRSATLPSGASLRCKITARPRRGSGLSSSRCDGAPSSGRHRRNGLGASPPHGRGVHRLEIPSRASSIGRSRCGEDTCAWIARRVRRFVPDSPRPFIVRTDMHKSNAGCAYDGLPTARSRRPAGTPRIAHAHPDWLRRGEGQAPRILDLYPASLGTAVAGGQKHGLVAAFLARQLREATNDGADLRCPMATITTKRPPRDRDGAPCARREQVCAFLTQHNGIERRRRRAAPARRDYDEEPFWHRDGARRRLRDRRHRDAHARRASFSARRGSLDSYVIDPGGMTEDRADQDVRNPWRPGRSDHRGEHAALELMTREEMNWKVDRRRLADGPRTAHRRQALRAAMLREVGLLEKAWRRPSKARSGYRSTPPGP